MSEIFKILLMIIVSVLIAFFTLYLYYSLNIKKEYRFLHYKHIIVLILDIVVISFIYFIIYIVGLFDTSVMNIYNNITSSNLILTSILSIYMLYKSIYKIYYELYEDKIINNAYDSLVKHYYFKDGSYYLYSYYITLSKVFRCSLIIIVLGLSLLIGIIDYIYDISFIDVVKIMESFIILPLLLLELSIYFDGELEENSLGRRNKRNRKVDMLWEELDNEYHRLWEKQLLSCYNILNKYESKIIEGTSKIDKVSMNITKGITNNETKDFIYSRVLSLIITGKNIIIESCLLESFSNIIIPIINIMFTASKRMMFICDSYDGVRQCSKWLEKLDIINSNIVVDILSYNDNETIKLDSKVDIYVGTVDLALNSKAVFENIDVVFCLNIDKIISENALNLNLLASFLSRDTNDSIQYIMFGNRVNGLVQTISQVFMKNDFEYQTINNGLDKQIKANFWSTENGWFQSAVLPGFASHNLGQLIPLSLPAFKFGIEKVNVVSLNQSLNDQKVSLQTAGQSLKKYINKDIVNIDDAIVLNQNENFLELDNNAVLVVEDTSNNAALVLSNWLKYTKGNMYLNVVVNPYILRDYIISNMDFFINNVEIIGNILPVSKTNIKLSVYRIINQLCYGYVSEDVILREIKNLDMTKKIDISSQEQIRFITETLENLTKRVFGVDVFFKSYLKPDKFSKGKSIEKKQYYKLLDSVKNELPDKLFKNIIFVDSEQDAKVLKRIPVFELYQNYLEGQYVSFDGKYYLIDRIDYDNGIVNLTYSSNNENVRYRQCREVSNVKHVGISKDLAVLKVHDSILKKSILCTDLEVNTKGYYIFNNEISFVPGKFGYKEVDVNKMGLCRKYKSTNVLVVNISSKTILEMNELDRFKLSFTLSILLNEIFETLFSNIKQYILVRSAFKDDNIYSKYSDDELIKLYKPIIDMDAMDGINIYITEDTELEKGITDTIIDSFDTIIMKLLYDYLYWLIKENNSTNNNVWYKSDGEDYINISKIDKLSFLKYGSNELCEYIDLEGVFNCLDELILDGNDTLTKSRLDFISKRIVADDFKVSPIEIKEKNNIIKKIQIKSKVKKEDKSFIERVKEYFRNRKKNVREKEIKKDKDIDKKDKNRVKKNKAIDNKKSKNESDVKL